MRIVPQRRNYADHGNERKDAAGRLQNECPRPPSLQPEQCMPESSRSPEAQAEHRARSQRRQAFPCAPFRRHNALRRHSLPQMVQSPEPAAPLPWSLSARTMCRGCCA